MSFADNPVFRQACRRQRYARLTNRDYSIIISITAPYPDDETTSWLGNAHHLRD